MTDELPNAAKPRHARPRPDPTTPDPIEIAMEAAAAGEAPEGVAHEVLRRQSTLIAWQIAGERAGFALKVLTGLAGLAVVGVIIAMAWRAHNAGGLIVEPLSMPPELAAQGLTGQVGAARLLDGVARMQADTQAPQVAGVYAADWGQAPRVEIPQTGISITELDKLLHQWLGHETRISGELTRTSTGLALTVRAGAAPAARFDGPAGEIDPLLAKAAEAVYGATQPERYAAWLNGHNRHPEADAIYHRLSISGPRQQRARALLNLYDPKEADPVRWARIQNAARLDPEGPEIAIQIAFWESGHGHTQAALDAANRALRILDGPRRRDYAPWYANLRRGELQGLVFSILGDDLARAKVSEATGDPTPDQPLIACRGCAGGAIVDAGNGYALNADGANMRRARERGFEVWAGEFPIVPGVRARQDFFLLYAIEDWPRMVAALEDPTINPLLVQGMGPDRANLGATALARVGRFAEATALLATAPADCYNCVVAKARVADLAGDVRAAEAGFARAVQLGPRLPLAHRERGRMLLRRGDAKGAVAEFAIAHRLSPNAPRVLAYWGEALLAQGDAAGAARKYAEAQPHAPRWGRLHLKWGEALAKLGKTDAAREKWRAASTMDLSAADRARLNALLAAKPA